MQGNEFERKRFPRKEEVSAVGKKASGNHNNAQSGEMCPVRVLDTLKLIDY